MKKIILVYVAVIFLLFASGYSWYTSEYKGSDYYVRIRSNYAPTEKEIYEKDRKIIQYTYSVQGFDEKGNSQALKLSTTHKIKSHSYFEVFYNKGKKSTDWIGRDRSEIPRNALERIE
jgi:uncharacterized protein (TIGR01655 family)